MPVDRNIYQNLFLGEYLKSVYSVPPSKAVADDVYIFEAKYDRCKSTDRTKIKF